MKSQATINRIKGMTLRFTFIEGPQAGKTYEHTFHPDGTVQYHMIDAEPAAASSSTEEDGSPSQAKRPKYAAYEVSAVVHLVSYLAPSGFTLTVALNFNVHTLASIASNNEQWFSARGTFAEMGSHN